MKKLALLMCVAFCFVFMAASHKPGTNRRQTSADSSSSNIIVEESLNGILQPDANAMVQNAVSNIDNLPANTQIWFSRATVDSVYGLLRADSGGVVKPDGVRIYFSSVPPTADNPLHYNNGIVVVSTYNSGKVFKNHLYVNVHTDYFEHPENAGLFKSNAIAGILTHDNDTTNGALLYNTCNCDTQHCITSAGHYITRIEGEKMVQAFYGSPFNARSEWFDIGMLKNLVEEMNLKSDDGINYKFDGIRIYFARGVAGIASSDDVGKARFVLVTTIPATNSAANQTIHKDYFGCDQVIMSVVIEGIEKRKGGNDNGEQCPNNCDGVTLP